MTQNEIVNKIKLTKENYINNNISIDDVMDLLDDLCCEIEECNGVFGMNSDDDYYEDFENTPDFTQLVVD